MINLDIYAHNARGPMKISCRCWSDKAIVALGFVQCRPVFLAEVEHPGLIVAVTAWSEPKPTVAQIVVKVFRQSARRLNGM
jgi:hypothetical protein